MNLLNNIIPAVFGVLFALFGGGVFIKLLGKLKSLKYNAVETTGTITGIDRTEWRRSTGGGASEYRFKIIITFRDLSGKENEVMMIQTGSKTSYIEGNKVPIKYNRDNPAVYIVGDKRNTVAGIFITFLIFIAGLAILLVNLHELLPLIIN